MQKLALIADVHGNFEALKAVIEDAHNEGVTEFITVGDMVLKGPGADLCMELLEKEKVHTYVLGNHELVYTDFLNDMDFRVTSKRRFIEKLVKFDLEVLGKERFEKLAGLPIKVSITAQSSRIDVFHAMPNCVNYPVLATQKQSCFDEMFADSEADIAICGHVHRQYLRKSTNEQIIINPGSVGLPSNTPSGDSDNRAQYAIITVDNLGIASINFRKVAYDVDREIECARKRQLPHYELYCESIKTGAYMYTSDNIERCLVK